ncbi:unnamed protein product, partial [Effrenium voratum]
AAASLMQHVGDTRARLVAELAKAPKELDVKAEGARLRWGRGPLGSAARAAAAEREAREAEVALRVQQNIGNSPIGWQFL